MRIIAPQGRILSDIQIIANPAVTCASLNHYWKWPRSRTTTNPVRTAGSHVWRGAINEPVWILSALFGFALLVQLLAYLYRTQRSLRLLQEKLNASTQIMLDCSHKVEWFKSRVENLLEAAQLQSCDVRQEQKRLDQLIRTIKTEPCSVVTVSVLVNWI